MYFDGDDRMKILVGISGGVDSAAAAKRLIGDGHTVEGIVLIMHEHTELCAAREAAMSIGIPLHEVDCTVEFDRVVKENFVSEYRSARTPNPCIICNERVKFRYMYEYAVAHGFDRIATGHYASVVKISDGLGERYAIAAGKDKRKDQSYMLHRLPSTILEKLLLPLADEEKTDVRAFADSVGISAADRPDSQEICFLPDGNHADFIESVAGKCPEGDFVDEEGHPLGRHRGIIRYTVGQRKGLGIALGERVFVTAIDAEKNTVTLSPTHTGRARIDLADVVCTGLAVAGEPVKLRAEVKIRYTAPLAWAEATVYPDGTASLIFDSPVKAAPGQSAVAYRDGTVLFGGIIR